MSNNVAKSVIKPSVSKQLRVTFFYTGQGDSAIIAVPTGDGVDDYTYILVDCDLDKEENEVNIKDVLKDLLGDEKLPIYINTHPHKDHTGGIKEIYDDIGITEVWHSNHTSIGKHKDSNDELQYVLKKIGKSNEFLLKGSDSINQLRKSDSSETKIVKKIGLVDYHIFAPAEYVCDEIEDETADQREKRIHEQCGVFKFSYKDKSILFTGDANKKAWQDHITEHHADKLKSDVMTASHHGSYTAFKNTSEDEEPYKTHLDKIDADYLVVSAPKQADSPHGHPHDDAMDIYKEKFEEDDIYHLGESGSNSKPFCFVVTIDEDGTLSVDEDVSLINSYSNKDEDDEKDERKESKSVNIITTKASLASPHVKL
jgi:beta-lactamase superfamily II metal-dependent hydrolase